MYGNKSIKHKADGTKYKDFYYYGCKHRTMIRGHKCDYKKQIREELLDDAVAEVIVKLVSNPKFAAMMQEKINMKVDTAAIDQEIAKVREKIAEYQDKLKTLEAQKTEAENLEIVQMVRALRMTPAQLSAMLSGGMVPGRAVGSANPEQEEMTHEE